MTEASASRGDSWGMRVAVVLGTSRPLRVSRGGSGASEAGLGGAWRLGQDFGLHPVGKEETGVLAARAGAAASGLNVTDFSGSHWRMMGKAQGVGSG